MTRIDLAAPGCAHGISIEAQPGQKLSAALWLSDRIAPSPLCNGLGLCGRCRCRFIADAPAPLADDIRYFSAAQLATGWRLACRRIVPDQACLKLELPQLAPAVHAATEAVPKPETANAFLGFDLGTTSIQWQAVNASGEVLAQGSQWNPQAGAGADVISRIRLALVPPGLRTLSQLVLNTLADILAQLSGQGIGISRACIAANTAMTEILLQKSISGLAAAPYHVSFAGGEIIQFALPGLPLLSAIIPPLPAPFVGGDISAGLLALLRIHHATPPFLLADLGTNAELALLDASGRLWFASAPLGPAMEGIGPQCGQPAGPDVITSFSLAPRGLDAHIPIPSSQPVGISATGYISLLALLLKTGILAPTGALQACAAMPITAKISANLAAGRLLLPHDQFIDAFDIELLLKVKAALALAIGQILAAASMEPAQINKFYLAGALGQHVNIDDLATLGFIPQSLAAKTTSCGNTSLAGACLLAANPQKLPELAKLCANAQIIDFANDAHYLQNYLQAMRWGQYAV